MSAAGFGPRPEPTTFATYTPVPGGGLLTLIGTASAGLTQVRLPDIDPAAILGPSWSDTPADVHGHPFTYVGPAALAQDF